MALKQQITLEQFITKRLGDQGEPLELLRRMFILSFGAASLREFWRYWNPVYGYFLNYYCYRPLRSVLPRPVCVLATFFVSGFVLHDLLFGWWIRAIRMQGLPFPFVGVWFALMGLFVVLTNALHPNWGNCSFTVRVLLNSACIVLAFLLALILSSLF